MPDDEAHLIRQAQSGDGEACAALYARHYDAVYRYCYYRVCDAILAEDLASEVFVRMVEKLDTFRPRGRPLLCWLYTIARHLIADLHRQKRRATHLALEEAEAFTANEEHVLERDVDRQLDSECLARALGRLTEEQRQVILLKFIENGTNAQVARLMSKTEGAIKALQHRALAALRRTLEREQCYES